MELASEGPDLLSYRKKDKLLLTKLVMKRKLVYIRWKRHNNGIKCCYQMKVRLNAFTSKYGIVSLYIRICDSLKLFEKLYKEYLLTL